MEAMLEKEKVKGYTAYRDSGVEWLGEIPEHWEVKRFKFIADTQKGKLPQKIVSQSESNLPAYMSMEYLRGGEENQWVLDKDAKVIDKGEILLLWDGSNAGEFIKSRKGVISSTVAQINFKKIEKSFAWYYSKFLEKELRQNTIGMGIPHVNGFILNNLPAILPSPTEQKLIANFLDLKTALIDKAIGIKEKQIELLKERRQILIHRAVTRGLDSNVKMKDSGVEWIGEVPEHWEVIKLKLLANKITDGEHISPTFTSFGMPFLSAKDVREGYIEFPDNKFVSEREGKKFRLRCNPENGDILLVSRGATIGRVSKVTTNEEFCLLGSVILIKPNFKVKSDYLLRSMENKLLQDNLLNTSYFSAQQALYLVNVSEVKIAVPPQQEQIEIVNHIETFTRKISTSIFLKKKEIEKLKEYKAVLINEAVTGKIKVG